MGNATLAIRYVPGGAAGAAGAIQPPAPQCRAGHRLPLLPYLGGAVELRGDSADQNLHELPLADLDERGDAGAGTRELPHRPVADVDRVNYLPDYVYFNHSIHINKGVGCDTCHGPVNKMPLMYQESSMRMEWCLECHRAPEKYLRPRDQVFNMDYEQPSEAHPVQLADGSKFTDQVELGTELHSQYNVRTVQDITSCNTCHR